jgi:hypothetical protein
MFGAVPVSAKNFYQVPSSRSWPSPSLSRHFPSLLLLVPFYCCCCSCSPSPSPPPPPCSHSLSVLCLKYILISRIGCSWAVAGEERDGAAVSRGRAGDVSPQGGAASIAERGCTAFVCRTKPLGVLSLCMPQPVMYAAPSHSVRIIHAGGGLPALLAGEERVCADGRRHERHDRPALGHRVRRLLPNGPRQGGMVLRRVRLLYAAPSHPLCTIRGRSTIGRAGRTYPTP